MKIPFFSSANTQPSAPESNRLQNIKNAAMYVPNQIQKTLSENRDAKSLAVTLGAAGLATGAIYYATRSDSKTEPS